MIVARFYDENISPDRLERAAVRKIGPVMRRPWLEVVGLVSRYRRPSTVADVIVVKVSVAVVSAFRRELGRGQ